MLSVFSFTSSKMDFVRFPAWTFSAKPSCRMGRIISACYFLLHFLAIQYSHHQIAAYSAEKIPNIVLVMADDQGWGDMAYNGHTDIKTPNFDQAARKGIRFNRFYAAAPVCSPTRASVMTGRHPNRMGVFKWGYPIRPQETTIAEKLKTAGYATAHFGKWHLGSVRKDSPANPGQNGFDEWLSAPNFYDNDPILSHRGKALPIQGESSMVAANAAVQWMTQQSRKNIPFFAVVWFGSPHSPHKATTVDKKPYADLDKKLQDFYGEITGMDRAFGAIRNALRKLKIHQNTLVWYCSDNGALPKVGSTGGFRGHKGKIYEGGLLVPAIIEWPSRFPTAITLDFRANTSDIFPTLLAAAGVQIKHERPMDGINLLPILGGTTEKREQGMGFWDYSINGIRTPSAAWMKELWEAQQAGKNIPPNQASLDAAQLPRPKFPNQKFPGHSAFISGDWKLHRMENKREEIRWELYNLKTDPFETKDLSVSNPEINKNLKAKLNQWLVSVVASLNGADY